MEAGRGNPEGRRAAESETHLLPPLGVPQEPQANTHNLHTESLVQTQAGHKTMCSLLQSLGAHVSPA